MTTITGGHLAAKYMQEVEKVRIVFTLSGGHIENILDGFTAIRHQNHRCTP